MRELEPPLDSRFVVSYFADVFERLVIHEDGKVRAPEVASKAFAGPVNAARSQVERSPLILRVEGSAVDVSDGPH